MKKRTIVWIAVLVVLALVALVAMRNIRQRRAAAAQTLETVAVWRDTLLATASSTGTVMPKEKLTLVFPSGGVLAAMRVGVGQKVDAGQELARLDTRQLELSVVQAEATLKVNEARLAQTNAGPSAADLAAAEAAVESAQGLYEAAKRKLGLKDEQLSIAELDLKRAELALQDAQAAYNLVAWRPEIGMLPQSGALQRATLDYERALANYKLQVAAIDDTSFRSAASQLAQAQAQLDKLQRSPTPEDVAIAEAQVEQSQAALEAAKLRVADAILLAPFSGTVVLVGPQVGELVSAATPIVVLADLQHYYIDASIDETDIGRLQVGQDVAITLDAVPDATLTGKVTQIDPLGSVAQGVVTYGVEIEVTSDQGMLRPNMTATVDIVVARKENALVVPNRAVRRGTAGRYQVEVVQEGKAQTRAVTIGLSNETVTEIVEGVSEGEQVVVSAQQTGLLQQFGGGGFLFGGGSR
jgi:HlyD family secretion protein